MALVLSFRGIQCCSCCTDSSGAAATYVQSICGRALKSKGLGGTEAFGHISCFTEIYVLKKSRIAFFITSRPTSEIDFVSGMSFGQTSTQFCA